MQQQVLLGGFFCFRKDYIPRIEENMHLQNLKHKSIQYRAGKSSKLRVAQKQAEKCKSNSWKIVIKVLFNFLSQKCHLCQNNLNKHFNQPYNCF